MLFVDVGLQEVSSVGAQQLDYVSEDVNAPDKLHDGHERTDAR